MEFKIRCHAIGKIMGQRGLGLTGKGYCEDWAKETIFGIKKSFKSKYTDKGLMVEDDSLDFVADHLGYGMLIKNEKRFEDELMTGTPDAIITDTVIDVKNSWDCHTFPLFTEKVPNKDYYWQAQGYMNLTGVDRYKLIYTLMNTPDEIIENEYAYTDQSLSFDEYKKTYTYDHIDNKYKIKVFNIEKNHEDIERIKDRVIECREYISTLI